LSHDADRRLLDAFAAAPVATTPAIALRHAKAAPRSTWKEPDRIRPLTGKGRAQSEAVADLLSQAYAPMRVATSPWRRCVQTVEPYAFRARATLELLDSIGEVEYEDDPVHAAEQLDAMVAEAEGGLLMCSHGNVMPALVAAAAGGDPRWTAAAGDQTLAKAEFVVIHRSEGRPVAVERHRV
jgi:8-oxo-dGTP diphosphatase